MTGRALLIAGAACFLLAAQALASPSTPYVIRENREEGLKNALLPLGLGLPVEDGYILSGIRIDKDRILFVLTQGGSSATLTVLPPEKESGPALPFRTEFLGDLGASVAAKRIEETLRSRHFWVWEKMRQTEISTSCTDDSLLEHPFRKLEQGAAAVRAHAVRWILALLFTALVLALAVWQFHRRGRRLAANLSLSGISLCLAWGVLEYAFAFVLPTPLPPDIWQKTCFVCYPRNPRHYFTPTPLPALNGKVAYCTFAFQKSWRECSASSFVDFPDAYRVVGLGDSCTEAVGVNFDDAWPARLERSLNRRDGLSARVRAVNCGRRASNIPEVEASFRDALERHKPALVIYAYNLNDARLYDRNISGVPESTAAHPAPPPPGAGLAESTLSTPLTSAILDRVRLSSMQDGNVRQDWLDAYATRRHPFLEYTLTRIDEMRQACEKRGCHFLVAVLPWFRGFNPYAAESSRATALMVGELDTRGIPYLDLAPYFQGMSAEEVCTFPTDPHPNEVAQAIIAAAIEEELSRRDWLPRSPDPAR